MAQRWSATFLVALALLSCLLKGCVEAQGAKGGAATGGFTFGQAHSVGKTQVPQVQQVQQAQTSYTPAKVPPKQGQTSYNPGVTQGQSGHGAAGHGSAGHGSAGHGSYGSSGHGSYGSLGYGSFGSSATYTGGKTQGHKTTPKAPPTQGQTSYNPGVTQGHSGHGSYGAGSYGAGSSGTGSYGAGSSGTGSYGAGSYGAGSSGAGGSYTAGKTQVVQGQTSYTPAKVPPKQGQTSYNPGVTQGQSGQGSYGAGSSGAGSSGTGSYGAGSSGTGSYGAGSAGTGSYGAGSSGTGSSGTGGSSYGKPQVSPGYTSYNPGVSQGQTGQGSYGAGSAGTGSYGAGSAGTGSYGAGSSGTGGSSYGKPQVSPGYTSYNPGVSQGQTGQGSYGAGSAGAGSYGAGSAGTGSYGGAGASQGQGGYNPANKLYHDQYTQDPQKPGPPPQQTKNPTQGQDPMVLQRPQPPVIQQGQQQHVAFAPPIPAKPVVPMDPDFLSCDVNRGGRVPCGYPGINADQCAAMKCCYEGNECFFGKAVTVQCTKDAQFIIVVSREATLPNIDLESVNLLGGGEGCAPVDYNAEFLIYQFPVTGCGSLVMEEPGMIIYENRMYSTLEVLQGDRGAITRDTQFQLLCQCRYVGTTVETLVVEVLPLDNPPLPVASLGPLEVMIRLANGVCQTKGCDEVQAAYSSFYEPGDYPVTKVLREPVYADVLLLRKTDPNLVLTLGHCWATTSSNPHSLPQWDILVNGCPYRDDRYLSALVPTGPASGLPYPTHHRRFLFKMFTFVNMGTSQNPVQAKKGDGSADESQGGVNPTREMIYIHCSTAVCSGHSCEPSCFRRRRDLPQRSVEPKTVVSSGPINIEELSEQ